MRPTNPDIAASDVLLARHAESVLNVTWEVINGRSNEIPITTKGRRQALWLGRVLSDRGVVVDTVHSSPAQRTRQTSHYCLNSMGIHLPIQIDDRLQELDTGIWTGHLRTQIYTPEQVAEIEQGDIDFAPPGGESMRQVGDRMFAWLQTQTPNKSGVQLAFTHGLAIRTLIGKLNGWDSRQIYDAPMVNTSLTGLSYRDSWQVDFMNFDPASVKLSE